MLRAYRPALELGQAHRREQHGVALAAGGQGLVGQGGALGEDRAAAEGMLGVVDPEGVEDADRLRRDLGPDPVAGEHGDDGHAHRALQRSVASVVTRWRAPPRRR